MREVSLAWTEEGPSGPAPPYCACPVAINPFIRYGIPLILYRIPL